MLVWVSYWMMVVYVLQPDGEGWTGEVIRILPQVVLGAMIYRWWALLLPLLVPLFFLGLDSGTCDEPGECMTIPAWLVAIIFVTIPGIVAVAAGMFIRFGLARAWLRRQPPPLPM